MVFGIGTDIVEIDRIRMAIERWGDDFIRHVFNKEEISYAEKHKFPYQHYAVRFAAKEAVFKAIGNDEVTWKDLTITNDADGRPSCRYKDKKFKKKILISMSHSKKYAVASAIITS